MVDAWIAQLGYRPGWKFRRGGPLGRYLCVFATCLDTVRAGQVRTTQHMFELPDEFADEREFARWAFARLLQADWHESAEWFEFQGRRPFFPHHQDEGSPYEPVERWES